MPNKINIYESTMWKYNYFPIWYLLAIFCYLNLNRIKNSVLQSQEPLFKRSAATCDWWLLYWRAQIQNIPTAAERVTGLDWTRILLYLPCEFLPSLASYLDITTLINFVFFISSWEKKNFITHLCILIQYIIYSVCI